MSGAVCCHMARDFLFLYVDSLGKKVGWCVYYLETTAVLTRNNYSLLHSLRRMPDDCSVCALCGVFETLWYDTTEGTLVTLYHLGCLVC